LSSLSLSNGSYGNLSFQSMAFSSFMNQWELIMIWPSNRVLNENSCAQWNIKKVPSSNQNRMIIFMTNGIEGFIIFLTLDILMGFLSSIIVNFVHLILTSYFFIFIISITSY
jgi:hypothetical protein